MTDTSPYLSLGEDLDYGPDPEWMLESVGPTTSGQMVLPPVASLAPLSTEQLTGVTATQEQLSDLLSSNPGFQFGINSIEPLFQGLSAAACSGVTATVGAPRSHFKIPLSVSRVAELETPRPSSPALLSQTTGPTGMSNDLSVHSNRTSLRALTT